MPRPPWSRLWHVLLAVLGAASLLLGVVGVIEGLTVHPQLDQSHLCRRAGQQGCARFRAGTSAGMHGGDLRVDYDGGEHSSIPFDGAYPPAGDPVRVERWDGDVVSVWDVHRERRYQSIFWPRPSDPYAWFFLLLGLVLLAGGLRRWLWARLGRSR